jgi:hypothetical protein
VQPTLNSIPALKRLPVSEDNDLIFVRNNTARLIQTMWNLTICFKFQINTSSWNSITSLENSRLAFVSVSLTQTNKCINKINMLNAQTF